MHTIARVQYEMYKTSKFNFIGHTFFTTLTVVRPDFLSHLTMFPRHRITSHYEQLGRNWLFFFLTILYRTYLNNNLFISFIYILYM